jgi:hypothetical protein
VEDKACNGLAQGAGNRSRFVFGGRLNTPVWLRKIALELANAIAAANVQQAKRQ